MTSKHILHEMYKACMYNNAQYLVNVIIVKIEAFLLIVSSLSL